MKAVESKQAPAPRGHYVQAVEHDGVIYVSVQLPIPPSGEPGEERVSVEAQAGQAIRNVLEIVHAGGGSRGTLLRVTVYVSDIALWPAVDDVYQRLMGDACPARGVVPTGKLHLGYDVAVDAIAAVAGR